MFFVGGVFGFVVFFLFLIKGSYRDRSPYSVLIYHIIIQSCERHDLNYLAVVLQP